MDALDEFFREWCEPEAWCERCNMYPAVHVVIQDDQAAYGSIVTYVRIWDPDTQTHIAVCRECSAHHIETLGTVKFEYGTQPSNSTRGRQPQTFWQGLRRHLGHWRQQIRTWLARRQKRCQKPAQEERYSRTGT